MSAAWIHLFIYSLWRTFSSHSLYVNNSKYRQGRCRSLHMRIFWHTPIISDTKAGEAVLRVSALLS